MLRARQGEAGWVIAEKATPHVPVRCGMLDGFWGPTLKQSEEGQDEQSNVMPGKRILYHSAFQVKASITHENHLSWRQHQLCMGAA